MINLRFLRRLVRRMMTQEGRDRLSGMARRLVDDKKPAYSESELLARTEEFNRAAEAYWRSIAADPAGRSHAFNKPFSTVKDTGAILYRLGLVLNELDLGVGHIVLDFGAGSCWLSACLNRLRCRTISVEISETALSLGRELFATDSRLTADFEPVFLPYDGHRIDLPPESVDRIVCFDAFHHVPNQDAVLAELYRVLRPGGRAVFAEPGEGHAHSNQSLFESEKTGVLENDLDIREIAAKARKVGFNRVLLKPYPDPSAITVTADEYQRLIEGSRRIYPLDVLRDNLRHFYLFVLTKGEPRHDSRNPRRLQSTIDVSAESSVLRGPAGAKRTFHARIRNTGDTLWLHAIHPAGGYVGLGGHLLDDKREVLVRGYTRASLPRDVPPGKSVDLDVDVDLPEHRGRYTLQLDMVDEWIAWFEQEGSKTTEIALVVDSYPDSRAPHRLAAAIELLSPPPGAAVRPGSPLRITLRLRNTGDTAWLNEPFGEFGAVALGASLLDELGAVRSRDLARMPLPRPVAPDEAVMMDLRFPAPPIPGRFVIKLDLVDEGVCWFEHHGSPTIAIAVQTNDEVPDSLAPGTLLARIEPTIVENALQAKASTALCFHAHVTNIGNTLWLSALKPSRGYVGLGAHLRNADFETVEMDFLRVMLPRDVPPGESVDLECRFTTPREPGRYVLELDMVNEHMCWFADHGSAVVGIELKVS
ncbi:MAG: methyltransferase domain-containing protein [Vicinamibacteria bacterium]|nr:methyltransferase domain-containing protein [Vicinamibacteria bacterium]